MIKAIYGKVKFNRHDCPSCGNSLLNKTLWFICDVCGYVDKDEPAQIYKIIVPPPGIRKVPSRFIQKELLKKQDNKCFWCGLLFGTVYWRNNKVRFLSMRWDHKIPFCYEQTNRDDNWAASCNVCNYFKYNKRFKESELRKIFPPEYIREIHETAQKKTIFHCPISLMQSATIKPASVESPEIVLPPCSNASGSIVLAIMVSIAPAATPSIPEI